MANDVLFYTALARELNEALINRKIEKIYQPSPTDVVFRMRGKTDETLYFSASPNAPRVYLSKKKRENPMDAPAFCMLLRKKLTGGIVTGVEVLNCDRALKFAIRTRTDLRDETTLYFIAEMMGRCSNLILLNEDFTILDAVKRIPIGGGSRPVLPNLRYEPVPHGKARLNDKEAILKTVFPEDAKAAASAVSGISKETAKEILLSASPADELLSLYQKASDGDIEPTVVTDGKTACGLLPFSYASQDGERKLFKTLSEASEFFYENRVQEVEEDKRVRELKRLAKKILQKYENKALDFQKKRENVDEIEKNKRYGELILNNIWKANPMMSILDCDDFENNTLVRVPLDPTLDAAKNAEAYFKKYRKAKRASEVAEAQLLEIERDKTYLFSVIESLDNVTTAKEIAEAEEELKALSGKRRAREANAKKQKGASSPLKLSVLGFTVYVGKNNRQNDEITFKIADRGDLWFHAKNFHGAHVLVKTTNAETPKEVILRAAELAAYYSGAKSSPKAEVDYTEKRFVKRQGATLGLVYYTDFKTVIVEPKP